MVAAIREVKVSERQLLTGGESDAPYPIPTVWDEDEDYQVAPDLWRIGLALIAECEELAHLHGATFKLLWRRKAAKKCGVPVLAQCLKPSGLLKWLTESDFILTVAADEAATRKLTNWQLEALLHETLSSADYDPEEGKPSIKGPDWFGFRENVARYRDWKDELTEAADAFQQISMDGLR